jgi:hypothetical protein
VLAFYGRVSQLQSRMKVQGRATDEGDEGGRRYAEKRRVYESYEMRAKCDLGVYCQRATMPLSVLQPSCVP